MNAYRRGRVVEYACVRELRQRGWWAQRTAGSHSPFDVVAWRCDGVRLIQVKSVAGGGSATAAVRRGDRAWLWNEPPDIEGVDLETWVWDGERFLIHSLSGT